MRSVRGLLCGVRCAPVGQNDNVKLFYFSPSNIERHAAVDDVIPRS